MKHRFITLMLLLLGATFAAEANPVDMKTAREIGLKFLNANTKAPLRNADELQWVTTYNTNRGDAAFYVFNTQDGFVIVSADDCTTPILGYSNEGHFDMENIPIQLQEYLQGFVDQIEYGIENHVQADKRTAEQWERVRTNGQLTNNRTDEVVEPLLTTKWDQGWPYNDLCPDGAVTGCMATAMAQIMKYWEWPLHGTSEHSYEWNGQTLSANFGETTYDWDNMLDKYYYNNTEYTQEQIEAISTLMYHCGVAVNMQYSANGSGAYDVDAFYALMGYFNYSDEMNYEGSLYFIDVTWKAKLKDCLDLRRPIFYSGQPTQGSPNDKGHAFVCDGYDSNELFHFNWGWGGNCDGYFAIGALNPYGSEYSYSNLAIFNIHPQGETTYYAINVSTDPVEGGVVSGSGTYAHGDSITLTAIPNEGYGFYYWEENGEPIATNPDFSFTANYNRDLKAVFASLEECIFFDDLKVREICLDHWDTNGDGKLSYGEAAAVTNLGEVFRGNRWITSFKELESFTGLTSIDDNAFNGCIGLTGELRIPNSVTRIGNSAFKGCNFSGDLVIPNSVTTIGNLAFANNSAGSSLIIGNSVTEIGQDAFKNCEFNGLNINMPIIPNDFVNHIGASFSGSLIIGDSVTLIGNRAFIGCKDFTGDLIIPNSVTIINNSTFENCYNFNSLTIPNSVTTIGDAAFKNCHWLSGNLIIPNSVTAIGNSAFDGCNGFTGDLIIGNSVVTIGEAAFCWCSGLTGSLTIPNSVTTIGNSAFKECSGFTGSLTIGNSVIEIGNSAFYDCSGFTGSLTIPNSMTTIKNSTFQNCYNLTSAVIGNSVTSIGGRAFDSCYGLNSITVLAETPPSITTTTFYEVLNATVKVPCGCLQAYKASAWNDYFTSIKQNCIGISEDSEDSENVASIYPNPTNGQMKIEVESIEYITISNELGQVIYEGKASGNTFEYDFSRHEAGAYLIKIETENGIITKRVFVTR